MRRHLADPQSRWSVGTYGAIGEFEYAPGEAGLTLDPERLSVSTTRGSLVVVDLSDVQALAFVDDGERVREVQARERLEESPSPADSDRFCVATVAYVYDHHTRDLGRRLTQAQHKHHDLQVATLHVHLDHESCLEVAVLRGPTDAVCELASETTSQRGVRHGHLHLVPAQLKEGRHAHGHGKHGHDHIHV